MKTIEINQMSWHYKLANFAVTNYDLEYRCNDVCDYTRKVLFGAFVFLIACVCGIMASVMFVWMFADTLAWIVASIVQGGFIYPNPPTIALLVVLALFTVIGALYSIPKGFAAINRTVDIPFVKTAYRSWKDKWCAKIEFK